MKSLKRVPWMKVVVDSWVGPVVHAGGEQLATGPGRGQEQRHSRST